MALPVTGVLPRLLLPARCLPGPTFARQLHLGQAAATVVASPSAASSSFSAGRPRSSSTPLQAGLARRRFGTSSSSSDGRSGSWASSVSLGVVALSALGWAHSRAGSSPIHCDSAPLPPPPPPPASADSPSSIINPYELGFGTVCGLCAGVFVKKGAKLLAFALGGVFVLLQYLNSLNLVKVNWSKIGARYTNATAQTDGAGATTVLTAKRVFNWVVDFLTRDFQQRATFVGGFVLGLRLG